MNGHATVKKKKAHRFCLRHGELWVVKVFTTCCVDEYWLKSHYTHAECGAHRVLVLSVSVIYRVPGDVTILVLYHRHQGRVRPRVNMAGKKKKKRNANMMFHGVSGDERISVIRWVKVDSHLHTLLKTQKTYQMRLVTLFWALQKENMWSLDFYHPHLATLVIFSSAGLLRNQTDPRRAGYSQTFGSSMLSWCIGVMANESKIKHVPSCRQAKANPWNTTGHRIKTRLAGALQNGLSTSLLLRYEGIMFEEMCIANKLKSAVSGMQSFHNLNEHCLVHTFWFWFCGPIAIFSKSALFLRF